MTPPRKRSRSGPSGPNVPESQRHTVRIALRLAPDVARALRDYADGLGVTIAAAVAELLRTGR